MPWSKIATVSAVVLFVFGFVMIDSAVAGEKIKWQGTSLTTETGEAEAIFSGPIRFSWRWCPTRLNYWVLLTSGDFYVKRKEKSTTM